MKKLKSKIKLRTYIALGLIAIMLPIAFFALFRANDTSAEWFDESWQYRKKITIDADEVSGSADLTNFVMLVSVTDTDLAAAAQNDGDDIVFTDINGARLAHEIANYTYSSGELEAWVRVPMVYAATDTILYMYYGNATATNSENPTAVWQESSGVWHMDESSGGASAVTRADFSPYGNHLEDNGDTPSTAGKIADALATNGSSQYLSITDANENAVGFDASYTLSAWVSMDSDAVAQGLVSRSDGNSDNDMELSWKDQGGGTYGFVLTHSASGGGTSTSNSTYNAASYTNDTLIYVSAVYDDAGDQLRWYINGSASGTTSSFTNHLTATTNPFWVGRVNSTYWDGRIDEVRYTPSARSADWIATEYANQNAPGTFMSFSGEEQTDGPVAIWKFDEGTDNTCPVVNTSNSSTIRQVLNGSTSLATNETSTTVTLSPALLDKNKAFMTFGIQVNETAPDCGQIAGEITNTTTLTFKRDNSGCNNSVTIEYYVAEFTSGVSVQHGSDTSGSLSNTTNITIDEVDTSKAFPIINTQNGFASFNEDDWAEAEITSSTNLQVRLEGANSHTFLYYQIVEYEDAAVQHGTISMPTSTGSVTDTLSNSVDLSKAWLMFSYRQDGDNTAMGNFMLRGRLTNSTTVAFDRDASTYGNINITWYVIEFNNDTSVQHNTVNFGTSDTQKDVTISAVDRTKSIATAGGMYYRGGKTSYTTTDNPGTGSMTLDLTSDTNLRLTRALTGSSTSDVGWFVVDFDDTAGIGNANDVCDPASGYHGERNGTSWQQPELCVSGKCVNFNGTDDTVDFLNRTNLGFERTDSFSISAWFRTGSEGTMSIISKADSSSPNSGWDLFTSSSGQIHFKLTNTASSNELEVRTGDTDYNDNRWHHIEATYDGSSTAGGINIYFDSKDEPLTTVTTNLSSSITNSINVYIGSRNGTDQFFKGSIDQVKIYPIERTSAQVLTDFNQYATNIATGNQVDLSSGLVGYWKLDETTGDATDSSGNGYTLTNNGTTTYVAAKYSFGSEHVPASTQYFSTASTINSVSAVSFWVNPDSTTNNYFNLTSTQYVTSSSGTLSATGFSSTFYVDGVATTTIAADTWQHVVVVLSSPINADTFYLGRANSGYFDGTLDDVRVYQRSLPIEDIRALYQYSPSPDGYWPFAEGTGTTVRDYSSYGNHGVIETYTPSDSAVIFQDSFTESSDTTLGSHTPDIGTSWTLDYDNYSGDIQVNASYDYLEPTTSVSGVGISYLTSPSPTSAEYDIYYTLKGVRDGTGTRTMHLIARMTDDDNYYSAGIQYNNTTSSPPQSQFFMYKVVSGTYTEINQVVLENTNVSAGDVIRFEVRDNAKTLYLNDTEVITTSDNSLTSAGDVGIGWGYIYGDYNSHIINQWKIDDFTVEEVGGATNTEPAWTPSVFGHSLTIDGVDDRVRIPDANRLDIGAGESFTISSWFKHPDISDSEDVLIAKYNNTTGDIGYKIAMTNAGLIECKIADDIDSDFAASTDAFDDNEWHHVACVKDGNTSLKLYIDGILKATDSTISATDTLTNNEPLYFGVDGDGDSGGWEGSFDEFKIYHYARTIEQVRQDMAGAIVGGGIGDPLPQPINYWNLDEQSGQSVHDMSGNNNGTLGASSSVSTDDPTWKTIADCKVNGCLSFDDGDYVDIGAGPITVNSVSFWINPTTTTEHILDLNGTSYIHINAGTLTAAGFTDPTIYVNGQETTSISSGTWQHVLVTTATAINASDLDLGRVEGVGSYSGLLDEVRFYNSMLSESQVKLDYNTASALAISTTSDEYEDVGDGTGNPPVGYWDLNENTGTHVGDKSGSNYNGTATSSTYWRVGKYGSAYNSPDNGTDKITIPYVNGMNNHNNFSVTAWIKRDGNLNDWNTIIDKGASGKTEWWFGFSSTNLLTASLNPGNESDGDRFYVYSTSTITDNIWHHVAVTYDQQNVKFYIDGRLDKTTPKTDAIYEGTSNITIGTSGSFGDLYGFKGTIDEIKIFHYPLNQAQISYDYNRSEPIAHYRLDECQGTEIHDASGNGNDGTLTVTTSGGNTNGVGNCETASSAWGSGAVGKYSASINFDGDGDYVDIGDTGRTDIYAVSFWAKPADTTESFLQLSSSDTVAVSSGTITVGGFGTETVYVDGVQTTSFPDNSWHHVTVVSSSAITANDMDIGRISTTYFAGQIDDVQVFNYIPSANQIRKLYNASSAVRFE